MNFDAYVDKTFIINLDHRTDRWEQILKELDKNHIKNYERFPAIKPVDDYINNPKNKKMYLNIFDNASKKKSTKWKHKYTLGSLGCCLSHYNVIKLAKERGYKRILILEDDARFKNKSIDIPDVFQSAINQLKKQKIEPDMFYLTSRDKEKIIPVDKNINRLTKAHWGTAYIVNQSVYDYILENVFSFNREIDVFYAHIMHPKFQCYVLAPKVVAQSLGFSDIVNEEVNYSHMVSLD